MCHGVHGRKRVHGQKGVHGTIEKEGAEVTTNSVCITWGRSQSVYITEFTVGKELMVGNDFMVQLKMRTQSSPHVVHASHRAEPKCMHHRIQCQKRIHSWKRVHGTI